MPRRNNNRRGNRKVARRSNNRAPYQYYQSPILKQITLDRVAMTLIDNVTISSGVSGSNSLIYTLNWNSFRDTQPMAHLFRYFDVVGHQCTFSLATTTAATDSFNGGAIAYLPINYLVEGQYTAGPNFEDPVLELQGAIDVQAGAKNVGRWFPNPYKQTFSTADAFSTTLVRVAGNIVAYFDDVGISETVGKLTVKTNVVFWGREFNATNPTLLSSRIGERLREEKILSDDQAFVTVLKT